jgi:hypothetical protein
MDPKPHGRPLRLDPAAQSGDPLLPAFLSRPAGAPAYHGFPLVPETAHEGWVFGAITDFLTPEGADAGEGFVVAPDGSRAGLVWEAGPGTFSEVLPPENGRWGVYAVWFPKSIHSLADLVECFHAVLPDLQRTHATLKARGAI